MIRDQQQLEDPTEQIRMRLLRYIYLAGIVTGFEAVVDENIVAETNNGHAGPFMEHMNKRYETALDHLAFLELNGQKPRLRTSFSRGVQDGIELITHSPDTTDS